MFKLLIQIQHTMRGDTHTKYCLIRKGRKGKYLESCLEKQCHFTPLVFSVERVVEEDKNTEMKKLYSAISNKWDRESL